MRTLLLLAATVLANVLGSCAHATDAPDRHWIARAGIHPLAPKPDNHPEFRLDNSVAVSLGATYLFTRHWGVEWFGALPAEHDVRDRNGDAVGAFDLLPMSLTAQYHISDAKGRVRAYAGVGVGYATFGDERTRGPLAGSSLGLEDTMGLAAAIGLDMNMGSRWFVNIDARWFDFDADLALNGASRGTLEIDPYALGLSLGRRLR